MKPKKSVIRLALPSAIIVAAFGLSSAHAQSPYTWIGTPSGAGQNWDLDSNWSGTGVPNAAGDIVNLTANWTGGITLNLITPTTTLGILNLTDTGGADNVTINAGTSTLILNNGTSNAQINLSSMGAGTGINTPLQLNSNLVVTNPTSFVLNGNITGAGGITKTGAGQLSIVNTTNSFAGNVAVQEGILNVDFGTRTLPTTTTLDISSGASFTFLQTNSNTRTLSGLTGAGTFTGTGGGQKTIIIDNLANNAFTGTINLSGTNGTSTNTFEKRNAGDYKLSGTGVLTMGGTTTGASSLILGAGKFILDNTGTNNTNRISDIVRLNQNGGDFQILGNASDVTTETMSNHIIGTTRGSRISLTPGSGQSTSLTLANLSQTAGSTSSNSRSTPGAILYRGTNLGVNAPGTADSTNILYPAAPALIGGAGTGAATSIINYALGDASASGLGTGLVTYDATKGIRLLDTGTEFTTLVDGSTTTDNAKLAAGTAIGSSTTVNSLLVQGNDTTAITGTLAITSGALVFDTSTSAALTGTLSVGSGSVGQNAYVSVLNPTGVVTLPGISYATSGSFSLVKQGAGTLVLTGQAGSSAGYIVAAGTLKAGGANTLFRNAASIGNVLRVQSGATADMAGSNQVVSNNSSISIEAGGTLTNTGANATFTTNGSSSDTTSTIAGTATDGTPGDGVTTGLVSLSVGGASSNTATLNVTHGGHILNNLSNTFSGSGSSSAGTATLNMTSVTATDDNTIHGAITLSNGGIARRVLNVDTTANSTTSDVAQTLGTATINMAAQTTSASSTLLTISSRAEGGSGNGNTLGSSNILAWTNDVVITSAGAGRFAAITVGSSGANSSGNLPADPLNAGVTQQLDALNVGGATTTLIATANNNYNLEFTGTTTLTHTAATIQTIDVAAGTLTLNAIDQSGGSHGLTKSGIGTLVMKGTGSYTGTTTVKAGNLTLGAAASIASTRIIVGDSATAAVLNVSAQPSSLLSIANGSTLSGVGSITGNATIESGGTYAVAIAATAAAQDPLVISGALNLDSNSIIDLTTAVAPEGGNYILATATGGINNSGAIVNYGSITGGSVTVIGNNLVLTVAVTNNYASWANAQTPPVTGGVDGDFDNDGVKNLIEYALADGGERGVFNTTTNTITFTKRGAPYGSDLTYDIESSTLLTEGSWSTLAKPPVVEDAGSISYTFTPGTPEKNFARLKVVQVIP